ncbi:MAG: hypothetical protein R3B95_11740 [Nitrospirales bacterium]|nr:hypothetical protein [Nitrospirales bacterium]
MAKTARLKPVGNDPTMPDRKRYIERDLPCKLTNEELLSIGKRLGALSDECEKRAVEKAAFNKELKEQEEKAQDEMSVLRRELRTGIQPRIIECEERHDFERGAVTIMRLDTGEIVEERTMTLADRQVAFEDWRPDEPGQSE